MLTAHTVRLYRAQLSSADESERCGRAAFAVRHLGEMRLLITATGDLDATNARALGRFVERHNPSRRHAAGREPAELLSVLQDEGATSAMLWRDY